MLRPRTRWLALAVGVILAASIGGAGPALAADSTGTVSGTLTDGGTPVANTSVLLLDSSGSIVLTAVTDSGGAYSFGSLAPGTYVVQFDLPGGFVEFAHGKSTFETADQISVTAGATTIVDESVLPHGALSGHVTNSDGSPAAGVNVQAQGRTNSASLSTSTDADGRYELPFAPAGDYTVSFQQGGGLTQYANNKTSFGGADPIHVDNGATTTLDQTLLPTGAIAGVLTDSHGQPVPNAFINVSSADGLFGSTSTGTDGSYRIVLFPDTYTVQIDLPDGRVQFVHGQTDSAQATPIVVAAGADTVVNEQVLPSGTISGHLTDADGNPVANTQVGLTNDSSSAFGFTDDSGAYSITAFTGTYRLEFDTAFGVQWAHGKTSPDQADPITVTADQTTTVNDTLNRTGSITVTATDNVTNAPIQSFCVIVDTVSGQVCTDNGSAHVPTVLPGRYIVDVEVTTGPSRFAQTTGVVVTSGQDTAVNLTVVDPGTVTTKIVDAATGAPVQSACLRLVDVAFPSTLGNGGPCTGPDGLITTDEPPGTYKAFVDIRDGIHGDQWVTANRGVGAFDSADNLTVKSGGTTTLPTIKLDKTGSITGKITDAATGQPVPQAFVSLASVSGENGGGGIAAGVDGQGRYTLSDLGPYKWTLFIAAPGSEAAEFAGDVANRDDAVPVKVTAGATTTFNVAMTPGTTLTGQITGPDGTVTRTARIIVFNAVTGEEMYDADDAGTPPVYTAHVLGPQKVKLFYEGSVNEVNYHGFVGGADIASATTFSIPVSGTKTINVTMTQLVN